MLLRAGNDRGFTLAELAVVTFIIGLMLVLGLPLLGKTGDSDLRTAGRRVSGTIKYFYNQAILDKLSYRLTFDLDHGLYLIDRQEENGEWKPLPDRWREARLPDSVTIKDIDVKGKGDVTKGTVAIQIYPVGWIDEAVLHLQEDDYRITMRISPLTGTTEFYDGFRDFR
ncbi:MAG: prepilin-type N-terminal cleavage/methylation domain-containing protein [Deltaproteobacteria bacterium]|jgi:prepilin-type N-terminal cleavage/methylation domain-containing protein